MKLRLTPLIYTLLGLLLVWGATSWLIAKTSREHFEVALEVLAKGRAQDFFEIEVLNYQQKVHGAMAELRVIPTSALIDEEIENSTFLLRQINGPVFINRDGVQLGLARWELTIEENDPDAPEELPIQLSGLFSGKKPIASVMIDFFDNAHMKTDSQAWSLSNWTVDSLAIEGEFDLASAQHQILMQLSGVKYRDRQFAMGFSDARLVSENSGQVNSNGPVSQPVTKLTIEANNGELILSDQSKKIPFNLQSHGSIWVINDTLSGDWQIKVPTGNKLGASGIDKVEESGRFQTDVNLQFREFLVSGFWQYLKNQSELFSLLQQAEWAMEDIETPEQQDFLRSLFLDADRIKQSQLDNPLKPLLLAERSQLAANVRVSAADTTVFSEMSLGGVAITMAGEQELALKGEARIKRKMLSQKWLALLDRWNKKQWFRRYETEFESDITVRNGRLLLNDLIMSVDRLSAELSQALTDQ